MITSTMSNPMEETWTDYYQQVHASTTTWLDYSNPQLQGQTFGIALESAGSVTGKRCLDVGCGRGPLSLALSALSASEVVGIEIIAETIEACRAKHSHVRWEVGSPNDVQFCRSLGRFDVIFMIEVLQYLDQKQAINNLWSTLNPGGRIVLIVPNKDNAIVQKTMARFGGSYCPPNPGDLPDLFSDLPDLECWAYRCMDFQPDQRIVPYAVSPWTTNTNLGTHPNRLSIVARKRDVTS